MFYIDREHHPIRNRIRHFIEWLSTRTRDNFEFLWEQRNWWELKGRTEYESRKKQQQQKNQMLFVGANWKANESHKKVNVVAASRWQGFSIRCRELILFNWENIYAIECFVCGKIFRKENQLILLFWVYVCSVCSLADRSIYLGKTHKNALSVGYLIYMSGLDKIL